MQLTAERSQKDAELAAIVQDSGFKVSMILRRLTEMLAW